MRIRVRINNEAFERIRTRARGLVLSEADRRGPLLVELGAVNIAQVRRAFTSRGATVPTGPWPAWSSRYAAWRARKGLGSRMMRLTDTLYGKFTSPTHGSHIRRWVRGLLYQFGAIDDVAAWHREGAGRLPVRSVIDKTAADHDEFSKRLVTFYQKRVAQVLRHS